MKDSDLTPQDKADIEELYARFDRRTLHPLIKKIYTKIIEARNAAFYYRNEAVAVKCAALRVLSGNAADLAKRDAIYALCREYAKADALTFSEQDKRAQRAATAEIQRLVELVKDMEVPTIRQFGMNGAMQ
jgi:hypothetical protein